MVLRSHTTPGARTIAGAWMLLVAFGVLSLPGDVRVEGTSHGTRIENEQRNANAPPLRAGQPPGVSPAAARAMLQALQAVNAPQLTDDDLRVLREFFQSAFFRSALQGSPARTRRQQ